MVILEKPGAGGSSQVRKLEGDTGTKCGRTLYASLDFHIYVSSGVELEIFKKDLRERERECEEID